LRIREPPLPKARHQKWPLETEGGNGAFVTGFETQRLSHLPRTPRNGGHSSAHPQLVGETGLPGWGAWIRTREWRNQKSLGYFDFITIFSRLRRKVLVLDQYVTSDFPTTATAHLLPKRFFWGVNPHSPSPSSLLCSADAHPGPLVMSAVPSPENPINIGVFGHVLRRPFAFGCGVLLVIHWLAQPPSHDGLQRK
jgi:hypothetical protein